MSKNITNNHPWNIFSDRDSSYIGTPQSEQIVGEAVC